MLRLCLFLFPFSGPASQDTAPRRIAQHPADQRERGAALCQEDSGSPRASALGKLQSKLDVGR
jgi:hypothetical protein